MPQQSSCSVEGCVAPFLAKGFCRRHYQQQPSERAKKAAYRAANPEKMKARDSKWGKEHPEEKRAYLKKYYAENKDALRNKSKAWVAANPAKAKAARKKWGQENAEKVRALRSLTPAVYRYSKSRAASRGLPWSLTEEAFSLLRRQPCLYCGFPIPKQGAGLDRIDNSRGYEPGNVVPCCTDCNITRGDHFSHAEMLELGPHVRAIKLRRAKAAEVVNSTFNRQNYDHNHLHTRR